MFQSIHTLTDFVSRTPVFCASEFSDKQRTFSNRKMQRGSTVSTPRSARHSEIVAAYEDTQLHFSGYSPRPSSASSTKSKRKSSSRNSRSPSNSFSFNYSDKLKSVVQTYKKGHEEHVEIQSVKESLTDDKLDKHFQIMTGRLPSPRLRYSPRRKLGQFACGV